MVGTAETLTHEWRREEGREGKRRGHGRALEGMGEENEGKVDYMHGEIAEG